MMELYSGRIVCCLLAIVCCAMEARGQIFQAGFATRDITPDIGMEQPGGYGKAFHRIKHDPCKVRAAVFDDGMGLVALVGVDALIIRKPTVSAARKAIQEKTGIAPEAILIAASHSHSAGPTGMVLPGEYDDAPELVRKLAYEKSSCANAEFLARVEKAIIEAVVEAHQNRAEAKAAVGFGEEGTVSFNRRFRMKSGLTATHPGQMNPEIIEPAGPIDPQVGVVGAWGKDGKLLGCIVNFACHATTGPGGTSADYVHYIEKVIQGFYGENAVVVFVAGNCGDVTQVDNRLEYELRQSGETVSMRVGGKVGAEALKVLLTIQSSAGVLAPLGVQSEVLQIKRRPPSPARLEKCLEMASKDPPKGLDQTEWTFAKEIVLLDARIRKEPVAPVEVQAMQVGPAVYLACPAEYFCEYGLQMKKGSRFPFTFPVSLANDCVGYVPTEEAFNKNGGGYETRLTSYSNLEITAGNQIRDALLRLGAKLTPGAVPSAPRHVPKAGPWRYGNVPPELE